MVSLTLLELRKAIANPTTSRKALDRVETSFISTTNLIPFSKLTTMLRPEPWAEY